MKPTTKLAAITPATSPIVSMNLNSILSFVVLGVMGWVGMKTANNADSLIELKTSQPYLNSTVQEMKNQLATLVTRAEMDSRISELKAEGAARENRIHTLELEVKTMQGTKEGKR